MPKSRLVTAWAATQSQMLRVRTISQVTRLNQTAAASSSAGGRHGAEGPFPPAVGDDQPHHAAAQEKLFDDRDHERQAEKADGEKRVGPGGVGAEPFKRRIRRALAEAPQAAGARGL